MNRLTLSIGLLFLLVLILNWPFVETNAPDNAGSSAEEAWRPNYQARNMRSTLYDKFGKVNHQVFAQKMEHYQLLGFTQFEQPQYNIYVVGQSQPWQVFAREGTLYEDNRIQLETDVEILNLDKDGFVQKVKADFIEIDLNDKTMRSDRPVEIIGHNYIVKGNGFQGDLSRQQYELKNHVQTSYQPTR